MRSGRLGLVLLLGGVAATLGAVGCFSSDNGSDAASDIHGGNNANPQPANSDALKSTLILDAGCTAAKVGPRQLLLAARCVASNTAFAPGGVLKFKIAMDVTQAQTQADAGADAAAPDAATDPDAGDAAAPAAPDAAAPVVPEQSVTIATVNVHPSFSTACATANACPMGSIAAAQVRDVAIVTLTADLTSVPTIPVDLDTVGTAAPLMTVNSGCSSIDGQPGAVHTSETIAVPAKVEDHFGSPFMTASMVALHTLDQDYVVTPANGWHRNAPSLCRGDIGAPLFRADKLAVAGITAGFTTYDKRQNVPVTLQHTRVDASSQVGPWLQSLGATTIRSCDGPCTQYSYDGGVPDLTAPDGYDAGVDASDFVTPTVGEETDLGPDTNDGYSSEDPDYADAGAGKKKTTSACSATPGVAGSSSFLPFFGIALALAALRRRR